MLIQIKDNKPFGESVSETSFRLMHPNISFSQSLSASDVEPFGFAIYEYTDAPETEQYQKAIEVEPVKNEDGVYLQTWALADMSNDERLIENERKSNDVRAQRNRLLTNSDWTQLADSTADKNAWATYRQALRDITQQAGFPFDVDYPSKPV